ncbi:lytic transglycosylase domain-containing protein [Streptomyces sp. NBC_00102]|uniref:lytic transglycosylase domain-containing protein n=1 Tax=Streptomyces sp. NBC_00102 TaxID=2975652 RepID=UPI0022578DEC|nr:lytic transglycosylase domain-containing protein [Streptomyces sp. NBC_00102]MCX5396391.1 lytic transglycosylase domain-containing protein [Streptomyces sp. NBC_00102]
MAAQFGRRLRRGATSTAVAAAVVAALSASQAPGAPLGLAAPSGGNDASTAAEPEQGAATGNDGYHTDLPPLTTPDAPAVSADLPATSAESGIPASVLGAYKQAQSAIAGTDPACRLPWQLLAAIGKVESGQARGGKVDASGTTLSPILGPALDGNGFALIQDTDNGAYDNDAVHDRAVGPMQFIPSTWATWGQDGNGDGRKDPNNVYDAALAAGRYLCAGSRDLSIDTDIDRAVLSYNHSTAYLSTVRSWFEYYNKGAHSVPDGTGVLPTTPGPATTPATGPVAPSPSPSASPSPTPSPGGKPGTASPSPSPTTPPSGKPGTTLPDGPPTTTTPPSPSQDLKLSGIENAGTGALTAMAGHEFAGRVTVRAVDGQTNGFAKAPVTFTISGDTDAHFAGGATSAEAVTATDGTASAPALVAGETTGDFQVHAVVGTTAQFSLDFAATVTARRADTVARTTSTALTAVQGGDFTDSVQVKATLDGAVASGVAVTATILTSDGEAVPEGQGPNFTGAGDSTVSTLTGLTTDADGLLSLPQIHAGTTAGTYKLRITTEGGAVLDIELVVEAPPAA